MCTDLFPKFFLKICEILENNKWIVKNVLSIWFSVSNRNRVLLWQKFYLSPRHDCIFNCIVKFTNLTTLHCLYCYWFLFLLFFSKLYFFKNIRQILIIFSDWIESNCIQQWHIVKDHFQHQDIIVLLRF